MATPEFIALKCDHCPNWYAWSNLRSGFVSAPTHEGSGNEIFHFETHASAYRAGREDGWYIAEVELCPVCADAYAIEKSSEEEAE